MFYLYRSSEPDVKARRPENSSPGGLHLTLREVLRWAEIAHRVLVQIDREPFVNSLSPQIAMSNSLKVGQLAARTGTTVRTLHHYDEIGLLKPERRSSSGHRLYGAAEIERLQQIKSLQGLGWSLEEVRDALTRRGLAPLEVVRLRLRQARHDLERQQRLVDLLVRIESCLQQARRPSVDLFLQTIEAMTMFDKYYTSEQLKQLEERRTEVGDDRIAAVQQEWQQLYADAEAEMNKGTDPADPAVQRLVRKSRELIEEFTGGDAGIRAALDNLYAQEPEVREQWGPPAAVRDYLAKAAAAVE